MHILVFFKFIFHSVYIDSSAQSVGPKFAIHVMNYKLVRAMMSIVVNTPSWKKTLLDQTLYIKKTYWTKRQ